MAPTLILDKSSLQSLGAKRALELARYFCLVVPPILLKEILCDLSKNKKGKDARAGVIALARKISIGNCYPIPSYEMLCVQDLMGNHVPVGNRKPVIFDKDVVFGEGGAFAISQPEKSALYRWQRGIFNDVDFDSARELRELAHGTDLDGLMSKLPKLNCAASNLSELLTELDALLAFPDAQLPALKCWCAALGCGPKTLAKIVERYEKSGSPHLKEFAPYAAESFRIRMLSQTGMTLNLLGKRRSNLVDLEYLYYLPFAQVFSSGDTFHRQLAPIFQSNDQSFESRDALFHALGEIAQLREDNSDAEPEANSLITLLWRKHCSGTVPTANLPRTTDESEVAAISEESKPLFEAAIAHHFRTAAGH